MPRSAGFLTYLNRRPWVLYMLVFAMFMVMHLVIFRDVVAAIPAIWSGESAVVREELVPFFDIQSQFFSENTSTLTNSEEVRVTYSFWTSWVRHDKVLPVALVVLNTVSAFILFHAFYKIGRYFSGRRVLLGILVAALAAFFIHFILLYSKVTHFYTLIFGFSLFAWSMSLVLEQLFARRDISWPRVFAVSGLALVNPAIHYHLIFCLALLVFIILQTLFIFILNWASFWFYLKRNALYLLAVTALSLVPYVIFLLLTVGATTSVPVNYWMIHYWSIGLPHLFSLDTASQIDMFQYGGYLSPVPRITSMIAFVLIGYLFLRKQWGELVVAKKFFICSMFITMLLAMWMSLGYSADSPFSFHSIIRGVALFLADQNNLVAQLLNKAIAVFINILRFPHRFQFIYFYLAGILLTVALLWFKDALGTRLKKPVLAAILVVLIMPLALLGSKDYILVLVSGNFNGFLAPYPISSDLTAIKDKLGRKQGNKLFIMPTMESGREIAGDNGNLYGFIDKFLIYFLDQPTVYYGTAGDDRNKLASYLVYQAIQEDRHGWETVLINNLGVTDIVVSKNLVDRPVGPVYMSGIEKKIDVALRQSQRFQPVFEGKDFALFEAIEPNNFEDQRLVDMDWGNLRQYLDGDYAADTRLYLPLQIEDAIQGSRTIRLVTDNLERSFYSLYAARASTAAFYPDTTQLPFDKDIIASSNFTNGALSLSTLDDKNNPYNEIGERLPSLANVPSAQFVGLGPGSAKLKLTLDVQVDGKYRVLLHAASKSDTIETVMGGHRIQFQKIAGDPAKKEDYIDFSYYYVDLDLVAGKQTLEVHNSNGQAVVVESGALMPEADVVTISPTLDTPQITIQPTGTEGEYDVTLKGDRS